MHVFFIKRRIIIFISTVCVQVRKYVKAETLIKRVLAHWPSFLFLLPIEFFLPLEVLMDGGGRDRREKPKK